MGCGGGGARLAAGGAGTGRAAGVAHQGPPAADGLRGGLPGRQPADVAVAVNYEFSYNNMDADGWMACHVYRLRAVLSTRLWRWLDVSLREKYEHSLGQHGFREMLLRQRLRLGHTLARSGVEPYVSVETFNSLFVGDGFRLARTRYRGGAAFPLGGGWTGDLFYLYQDSPAKGTHVMGLAGTYRF